MGILSANCRTAGILLLDVNCKEAVRRGQGGVSVGTISFESVQEDAD